MGVCLNRESEGPGKSEISELNVVSLSVDEQVLRLEITMENSMLVQVDECEQDLVQEELCLLFGEWLIALLLHVFLQVELQILKDQVQLVLTVDDLLKLYYIWVSESLQQTDLSDRS